MQEKKGISGITHPLDEPRSFRENYPAPKPKDYGFNQLVKAPKEIVETGFQAVLGALTIVLARALVIRDSVAQAEKDLSIYESQLNKGKGNTEKLQKKIDKIKASLVDLNRGAELSEQILEIQERYNNLLADDRYLFSLLAKTIGNEGLTTIERNFLASQQTKVGVKPVTDEEVKLAQKFFARADDDEERSGLLEQYIQQLEKTNLLVLGKQLVNLAKIKEIAEINEETDFIINSVSWSEALVASIMGATGRTPESMRGGYKVKMEKGTLSFSAGQDVSEIASMEQIAVEADIPKNIESALSVANGEVPLFKSKFISSLIRKAMGDYSLLPGRIDIGRTGSESTKSYPALNVRRQMNNINLVGEATIEMQNILQGIEQIDLNKDDNQTTQKNKLIAVGIGGALEIPRYQVIVDLIKQISLTESATIANLSKQYRYVPGPEEVADDVLNDQNLDNETDIAEEDQEDQVDDSVVNQELDLIKAGFPQGIDQRTATLIHKHPESYRDYFIEQFGKKEGKRIAKVVEQAARSVLNIDWDFSDDFDRVGLALDLCSAGYDMDMSEEQAREYIDNLSLYRRIFIQKYGSAQGNRIADQVKEFAKQVLGQDGN